MIDKTALQVTELQTMRDIVYDLTDVVRTIQEIRSTLLRIETECYQVDDNDLEQKTDEIIIRIWALRNGLEEHINDMI